MDQRTEGGGDTGMMREIEERLRSRLSALESDNDRLRGRLRLFGFGLFVTLGLVAIVVVRPDLLASVGLGAGTGVVEAHRFVLVDENGLERGEWSISDDGGVRLSLNDEQRRPRANLTVLQGGSPGLAFINANGQRRAVLGLLPDETTTLVFADPKGVPRAVFGLTRADAANLVLADANGQTRIGLGLDGDGIGSVMLPAGSDEDGSNDESDLFRP